MPPGLQADLALPTTSVTGGPSPTSADHQRAMLEAQKIAESMGHAVSTSDILIGMLRVGGAAARLLAERGIQGTTIHIFQGKEVEFLTIFTIFPKRPFGMDQANNMVVP